MSADLPRVVNNLLAAANPGSAQLAASDVLDVALDGGCALSDLGGPVVLALVEGTRTAQLRTYVLATLIAIGRWIGVWGRAASDGVDNEAVTHGVDAERIAESALQRVVADLLESPLAADPEERTLVYRLCGIGAGDPDRAIQWLMGHARLELNERALGSAAEAVAVLLARFTSKPPQPALDWLRSRARAESSSVVQRRLAIAPHDFVGESTDANRRFIEELVAVRLPADGYSEMWPSELL